jgi:transposase
MPSEQSSHRSSAATRTDSRSRTSSGATAPRPTASSTTSPPNSRLPLALAVPAANLHDSQAFEPLVQGIPRVRSKRGPHRRKPAKLHADKAYDIPDCHRTLRERRIGDRIARRGIESSTRLCRLRWAVERTIAWLGGYRRLAIRYERHGHLFAAFLALAAALTCYKKLTN